MLGFRNDGGWFSVFPFWTLVFEVFTKTLVVIIITSKIVGPDLKRCTGGAAVGRAAPPLLLVASPRGMADTPRGLTKIRTGTKIGCAK